MIYFKPPGTFRQTQKTYPFLKHTVKSDIDLQIFQVVDKQIVACLDEMVVNILMCLYDSDDLDESIRNLDPQPNPPFYNSYNIKTTLDYLTKSFSGSGKSLVEILCKYTVLGFVHST